MTQWNAVFGPSIDDFIAQLTTHATDSGGTVRPRRGRVLPGDVDQHHQHQRVSGTTPSYGVSCVAFPGGTYAGGGFVTDHRGVSYPIVVPRIETDEGDVYTADLLPRRRRRAERRHARWNRPRVGGRRRGHRRRPLPGGPVASPISSPGSSPGTTGLVGPLPPNSGLAYIARASTVVRRTSPTPRRSPRTGRRATGGRCARSRRQLARRRSSRAPRRWPSPIAQGGVMAAAMDNQTQRAYQVIFEENADGRRRARIQTFTLAARRRGRRRRSSPSTSIVDGDGDVDVADDQLRQSVRDRRRTRSWSTDDVADFAFSGAPRSSTQFPTRRSRDGAAGGWRVSVTRQRGVAAA